MQKTIVYVDGFNLYWGMHDKGWRCYYWLNLWNLSTRLIRPGQSLVAVKYFTSKIKKPADKRKRQLAYLTVLQTTPGVERYFGKYGVTSYTCDNCGYKGESPQEKMTDVQLASHLVADAFRDRFDVALVVSGDRDLVPAVETCRRERVGKRVVAVFPPLRSCDDLRSACHAFIHITEAELKASQFPYRVVDSLGRDVDCPPEWQ